MHILRPTHGFTLVEVLVTLGVFLIVSVGAASLVLTSIQSNAVIWEQLATQNDGRQVLAEVINDVRRAEVSSIGSYPINTADEYELILYADVDGQADRERVHYWLDNELLYKGVTKPSGAPLEYNTSTEQIKVLAEDVKNYTQGQPIFSYYGENYTGTSTPLTQPVNVTAIRMIRVSLELEEDPTKTPVPLHVESIAHIRNLKEN